MHKSASLVGLFLVSMTVMILLVAAPQKMIAAQCLARACTPTPAKRNSNQKKPTSTSVPPTFTATPTETAVPTATHTPLPSATATAVEAAPTATQLACPSPVAAVAAGTGPGQPAVNGGSPLLPWFLGGAGLILGLGLGFFTGGVRAGRGRFVPFGGGSGPTLAKWDKWDKFDKWDKWDKWGRQPGEIQAAKDDLNTDGEHAWAEGMRSEGGFPKLDGASKDAPAPTDAPLSKLDKWDKWDKWQKLDTGEATTTAGSSNVSPNPQDEASSTFHKLSDSELDSGMGDGSVRPGE